MQQKESISLDKVAALLAGLSDPTRLRLISLIAQNGETCVCDLVDATGLNQTTVSRHLSTLRHAGLVSGRKQGQWVYYSLVKPVNDVHRQLLHLVKKAVDVTPQLRADYESLKSSCCASDATPVSIALPKR